MTQQNLKSSEIIEVVPMPPLKAVASSFADSINKYTHQKMLQALYWIWDGFDRALMKMFVVGKTYDSVKNNKDLEGDKIEVGVRKLEWDSGSKNILDAFVGQPTSSSEDSVTYDYNGIPVIVHIYPEDTSITSLDTKMYFGENFCMPTPYSRFEKYLWK